MPLLTVLDMHRLVEQDLQKMGFFAYDDLETEEIDLKLNEQIYAFIEDTVAISKGKPPRLTIEDGFQANQVSLDSLRTIHSKDAPTVLTDFSEGRKFPLPNDYLHHIKTRLEVGYVCNENGQELTKTVTPFPSLRVGETQHIDNMRRSAFHKSVKESPLGEIVGTDVYIYTDGNFLVNSAYLDYIRKPAKVLYAKDINGAYDSVNSIHCDLPDSVHYMIVNMTVIKIMKVIESSQQKIVNIEQS